MTAKHKIDREKMLQLYNEGYTPNEIADYFGTKSGLNIEKKLRAEGAKAPMTDTFVSPSIFPVLPVPSHTDRKVPE